MKSFAISYLEANTTTPVLAGIGGVGTVPRLVAPHARVVFVASLLLSLRVTVTMINGLYVDSGPFEPW